MSKNLFTIDAFSEVPFKGNPAAVILMDADDDISDSILQSIAEEVNLSETAFVRPVAGGDASASAHALFSHPSRAASLPRILRFNTLSGELTVERLPDGDLCMVLPLNAPAACSNNSYSPTVSIASGGHTIVAVWLSLSAKKLVVHIDATVDELRRLSPDSAALHATHDGSEFKGVIVTIAGGESPTIDFSSRYFAPWNGIPEDPVTGSAHTVLAPYWSALLKKVSFFARQESKRGGSLKVWLADGKTFISGRAVTVTEGTINRIAFVKR